MPVANPFPGMNPYLERHWGDIHHRLVQYACDQLQENLPGPLRARVEERVFVEAELGWSRNIYPDVRIIERRRGYGAGGTPSEAGVAVAEPLVIQRPSEQITEGFIEIRDAEAGNRVITVIEVLSMSNKAGGTGTKEYQKKQDELRRAEASLVEIDLLRGGRRVFTFEEGIVPSTHRTPYLMCVTRGSRPDWVEIYRAPLRERLPIIRIPLRPTDPDAHLDLQVLIDQAYRMGRYDDIDYRSEPLPLLEAEDAKWAGQLLAEKGLR